MIQSNRAIFKTGVQSGVCLCFYRSANIFSRFGKGEDGSALSNKRERRPAQPFDWPTKVSIRLATKAVQIGNRVMRNNKGYPFYIFDKAKHIFKKKDRSKFYFETALYFRKLKYR